jgi:FKBP-type peptidyl-prolyl cis-trans isomerase 2
MSGATTGQTVRVHYTGTLKDGTQFETSVGNDPLEVTIGNGGLLPAFEDGLVGMAPGDTKTVNIPSSEAYGPHRSELVRDVPRDRIPDEIDLEIGTQLEASGEDGTVVRLRVTAVTDANVTVDLNHPLAGEDLVFELELLEVV